MNSRVKPIDVHIAKRLRDLRVAKGDKDRVRLNAVAGTLGITYQSYQKMEAGKGSFRASTLMELANYFGVPVSYFYDDGPVPDLPNLEEVMSIGAVVRRMDRATAQEVLRLASARSKSGGLE